MSLSGTCDLVPGKVFNTGANDGKGEWITLEKLNQLGAPAVRVGVGQITSRELDTGISGTIAGNSVLIQEETDARILADAAFVTQLETIQASVDANAASITSESLVRAGVDNDLFDYILGLSGDLDTLEGQHGALAAQVTTLQANYNGTAASVEIIETAYVSGGVAKSIVAFNLTAGNKIAGWKLVNDGTTADAIWQVDKFIIDDGSAGQVPFEQDGSDIFIKTAFIRNLSASQITVGEFDTNRIADNAITAVKILSGAVTGVKIANGAITASRIAAGTITANEIAAGTITGSLIAAGTIQASNIQAGSIGTTQLAAGSVTAAKIAAGTIEASNIKAGTIVADRISAGAIDNVRMGTSAVGTTNIIVGAVSISRIGNNNFFWVSSGGSYNACSVNAGNNSAYKAVLTASFMFQDGGSGTNQPELYCYFRGNSSGTLYSTGRYFWCFQNGKTLCSFNTAITSVVDSQYTLVVSIVKMNGTGNVTTAVITSLETFR